MPYLRFEQITGESNESMMEVVKLQFEKIIKPIYGPQEKAVKQIELSKDRTCEMLFDESDAPVGILVYKSDLQNEFKNFGICDSVEIKSLFVINPVGNKGRGYGRMLVDRAFEICAEKKAQGMHVTIAETVQDSLRMFKRNGFEIVHTWIGKYKEGVKEHLLFYKSP